MARIFMMLTLQEELSGRSVVKTEVASDEKEPFDVPADACASYSSEITELQYPN